MGKKELKEEIKLLKGINDVLASKICYQLFGREIFEKARAFEGIEFDIIQKEMDMMDEELKETRVQLMKYYFGDEEDTG